METLKTPPTIRFADGMRKKAGTETAAVIPGQCPAHGAEVMTAAVTTATAEALQGRIFRELEEETAAAVIIIPVRVKYFYLDKGPVRLILSRTLKKLFKNSRDCVIFIYDFYRGGAEIWQKISM